MDKQKLKHLCLEKIEKQQTQLQGLINDVQASSNNETKSTAGDKHDTARAQAQIEVERLSKQLTLIHQMRDELNKLPTEDSDKIKSGSYVETTAGNFYISVALGKMELEDDSFFAISMKSPLFASLVAKNCGDSFILVNGQSVSIVSVR